MAKSADFKDKTETNLSIKCVGGCQLFGPFVHFQLNDYKNDEPIVEKRNAFNVLMFAGKAVTLEYPEKFGSNPDECARGDYRLRNDFIVLVLKQNGMGIPGGLVETVGKPNVDSFSNIFFYILPHLSKIELFNCFLKDVEIKEQTYNNPETHKNKARLSSDVLNVKLQGLYDIKITFVESKVQEIK